MSGDAKISGVEVEVKVDVEGSGDGLTASLLSNNPENEGDTTSHAEEALCRTVGSMACAGIIIGGGFLSQFLIRLIKEDNAACKALGKNCDFDSYLRNNPIGYGFVLAGIFISMIFAFVRFIKATHKAHEEASKTRGEKVKAWLRMLLSLEFAGLTVGGGLLINYLAELIRIDVAAGNAVFKHCFETGSPSDLCTSPTYNSEAYGWASAGIAIGMVPTAIFAAYFAYKAHKDAKSPVLKATLAGIIALELAGFTVGTGFFLNYMFELLHECGDHCNYEDYPSAYRFLIVMAFPFMFTGAYYLVKYSLYAYVSAQQAYEEATPGVKTLVTGAAALGLAGVTVAGGFFIKHLSDLIDECVYGTVCADKEYDTGYGFAALGIGVVMLFTCLGACGTAGLTRYNCSLFRAQSAAQTAASGNMSALEKEKSVANSL